MVQTVLANGNFEDFKIEHSRIEWLMPYVTLSDKRKIRLFSNIEKDITVSFRTKHDKACLDCQNVRSVAETTFRHLGLPNESQISQRCKRQPYRSLQHHQRVTLLEFAVLSVRQHESRCESPSVRHVVRDVRQLSKCVLWQGRMLTKQDFLAHALLIIIDCSKQN